MEVQSFRAYKASIPAMYAIFAASGATFNSQDKEYLTLNHLTLERENKSPLDFLEKMEAEFNFYKTAPEREIKSVIQDAGLPLPDGEKVFLLKMALVAADQSPDPENLKRTYLRKVQNWLQLGPNATSRWEQISREFW